MNFTFLLYLFTLIIQILPCIHFLFMLITNYILLSFVHNCFCLCEWMISCLIKVSSNIIFVIKLFKMLKLLSNAKWSFSQNIFQIFRFEFKLKPRSTSSIFIQIKLKHLIIIKHYFIKDEKGDGLEPSIPLLDCVGTSFFTRLFKQLSYLKKLIIRSNQIHFHNNLDEKGSGLEPYIPFPE